MVPGHGVHRSPADFALPKLTNAFVWVRSIADNVAEAPDGVKASERHCIDYYALKGVEITVYVRDDCAPHDQVSQTKRARGPT